MGLEANCKVILNGQGYEGRAHCGDGEIDFKGHVRFRWKWAELDSLTSDAESLKITRMGDTAEFLLGLEQSQKWLHQIKNPKSRLDKLGLKPSHRYQTDGGFEEAFLRELAERAGPPHESGPFDAIFTVMEASEELDRLTRLRETIEPNGMIWVVWPKGKTELREDDIRKFALANGLVDVKVASFSEKLSALKLVIPVAMRTI